MSTDDCTYLLWPYSRTIYDVEWLKEPEEKTAFLNLVYVISIFVTI